MRVCTVLAVLVFLGLGSALAACNTIEGIGKDISATGRALNRAAGNY